MATKRASCQVEQCPLFQIKDEVPFDGDVKAKLVGVGESPGYVELKDHKPFRGDSGKLLRECCGEVGLPYSELFLANAARCCIDKKVLKPKEIREVLACCRPNVIRAIRFIKPRAVVLFGDFAMQTVLKKSGITKARGNWVRSTEFDCWMLPVFHPAYILRNMGLRGRTLSMGFAGYALLFVESEDPERASAFYSRALGYGIKALGDNGALLQYREGSPQAVTAAIRNMDQNDLEALFWTTLSWNAWINLNLDKPSALTELSFSEACLKRVLELDEHYFYSAPHILMGASLAARPPLLGGSPEKARAHFEQALQKNHGNFYLAQVYFAKYYAVRVQDRELFTRALAEVIHGNPGDLKDVCLINRVMQSRAQELGKQADDLFL